MMLLLSSKYKTIEGKGKFYLVEGKGKYYLVEHKGPTSQNTTENLKDAMASYPNGEARKWGRREPYKGKRRRKGKDHKETGWLDEIRKGKDYKGGGLQGGRITKGKDYEG